jgi:tetratricopeptide (TPR) repeat protein
LQELAAQMSETGRLAEAEPLLREALALYEKHLARSRDVGDRVKLARSHWSLVGQLYRSKRYPEAEDHARRALELVKRAVADAPLVPSYRRLLAAHWDGLALILKERGQVREAEEASRLGLAELEELVKQYPKEPHYAHALGGALHNLAGRHLERGELAQARELLDRALGHQRFALQTNPKHPTYRRFMRNHQLLLAETLVLLREPAEAARAVAELPPVARERYQDYDYAARYFAQRVPSAGRGQKLAAEAREECARSYADLAMEFLRESLRAGYKDRKSLAADAVFEPLRSRPDFQQLLTDLAGATDPKSR